VSHRRWWGYAFGLWAWALGAPIVLVILNMVTSTSSGSLLACPVCGSHAITCPHRAWAQVGLHVTGLAAILWAWSRRDPEATASEVPTRAADRWLAASIQTAFMAVALNYETSEVTTIVWSGPLIVCLGCLLVAPGGGVTTRVAGATSLLTALIGFYMIVLFNLSPHEAERPIFILGAAGSLITACATGLAVLARFRRRSA